MSDALTKRRKSLLDRGVVMPDPGAVYVGEEVDPERIGPGAVLHPGTRLLGESVSVGPESEIGAEAPATVQDCQLGYGAALKGGFYSGATFLDGASVGSSAHIRPGTLMEEGSEAAHAAGFKQTILFPYVVTGSLINFCDVLMAGGTSRKDHSEVGSSYIHFNFTPHGDKATASLVGDVSRGVFLDQPPIFLGGQGGLVGPRQVAYGTIVAAGTILRRDVREPGQLVTGPAGGGKQSERPYEPALYRRIEPLVAANLRYIGNIRALMAWYGAVRAPVMEADPYRAMCLAGAQARLQTVLKERIKRLGAVAEKMERSVSIGRGQGALSESEIAAQEAFRDGWPAMKARLESGAEEKAVDRAARDAFFAAWEAGGTGSVPERVAALDAEAREAGRAWLDSIVAGVCEG